MLGKGNIIRPDFLFCPFFPTLCALLHLVLEVLSELTGNLKEGRLCWMGHLPRSGILLPGLGTGRGNRQSTGRFGAAAPWGRDRALESCRQEVVGPRLGVTGVGGPGERGGGISGFAPHPSHSLHPTHPQLHCPGLLTC